MWRYLLYLNGLQCKPLQLRNGLFSIISFSIFCIERFVVQTVAIKKYLIQYFFVLEWFEVQTVAIKKCLI